MVTAVFHTRRIPWHRRYEDFFLAGFKRYGVNVRVTTEDNVKIAGDFHVLLGPNAWKAVERSGVDYLMVNRAFVGNEKDNVAIGWNGLNGRGTFLAESRIGTRDENSYLEESGKKSLGGWRKAGDYLLLCGQYDLGRCNRYASLSEWYSYVSGTSADRVVFRPWPGKGDRIPIEAQMRQARVAATLNSTVSVQTLAFGLPTIAFDAGNPVYAVVGHKLGEVKYPRNRLPFLDYVANCQYHHSQITNGLFWDHLRQYLDDRKPWQPLYRWSGD